MAMNNWYMYEPLWSMKIWHLEVYVNKHLIGFISNQQIYFKREKFDVFNMYIHYIPSFFNLYIIMTSKVKLIQFKIKLTSPF